MNELHPIKNVSRTIINHLDLNIKKGNREVCCIGTVSKKMQMNEAKNRTTTRKVSEIMNKSEHSKVHAAELVCRHVNRNYCAKLAEGDEEKEDYPTKEPVTVGEPGCEFDNTAELHAIVFRTKMKGLIK